jgi:hypothetical protein
VILSEGNSPTRGVDLDMMYGSFEPVNDMPREAVALTPRAADCCDSKFLTTKIAGQYLVKDRVVILRLGPNRTVPLIGQMGDLLFTVSGTRESLVATMSSESFTKIDGIFSQGIISWNLPEASRHLFDSSEWIRLGSTRITGEWWTGFSMITLYKNEDMSGTGRGKWGLRYVELRLVERLDEDTGPGVEWIVECVLAPPVGSFSSPVTMQGVLCPKYIGTRRSSAQSWASDQPPILSVIHWGNGQYWEQVTVTP